MPRAEPSPAPRHGYGRMERLLHWAIALLIAAAIYLGLTMTDLPATDEAEIAEVFRTYSLHKTIGVAVLALALIRILWTLARPGPGPLHPERRIETFLARFTHWTLWIAMLALPATGLLHHSAAPGFAPILWPLGQVLPLVPADERLALIFRSIHEAAGWVLFVALALHVLGALKHAVIDRDATLWRMVTGHGPNVARMRPTRVAPAMACLLWSTVIVTAAIRAPEPESDPFETFEGFDIFGEPRNAAAPVN